MYLRMQRDIEQVVPRRVRDEFGDTRQPLVGDDSLRLTRGGWRNPAGRQRSTLQRVGYAYEEQQLVRYAWSVLDRAQDSEPLKQPLTEDVERMQLRYLDDDDVWKERWPDTAGFVSNEVAADVSEFPELPKAVEVNLEHKTYGTLVWLFQLP